MYIAGHGQTFQFFKPIDGVCYIIAGIGGAPLYKVDPDDAGLLYTTASAGFTSLDVTDSTLTVTFIGLRGKAHFEHATRKGTVLVALRVGVSDFSSVIIDEQPPVRAAPSSFFG